MVFGVLGLVLCVLGLGLCALYHHVRFGDVNSIVKCEIWKSSHFAYYLSRKPKWDRTCIGIPFIGMLLPNKYYC